MEGKFNPGSIHDKGDQPPNERLVQMYVDRLRKGLGVAMPVLVPGADGRCRPLGEVNRCKVEAAHRLGQEEIPAYIVEEDLNDPNQPAMLAKLARELDRQIEGN